jgi:endonuclease G
MRKLLASILIFFLCAMSVTAQIEIVLGNPSNAAASDPNNFLVIHTGYILSYNKQRGAANWVMWHVQSSDLGGLDRSNAFAPDALLPPNSQIKPQDYIGSGYDKGHLCPSGDRTSSPGANIETFLMSNMSPQTAKLNRQTWKSLEDYTRAEIKKKQESYIIAGCYGNAGRIKKKITIPTNCFKIVILLPEGTNDLARITAKTRVIAVDIPNSISVDSNWKLFRTTVDAIELSTGFDFFTKIPNDIEKILEAKTDSQ